MSAEPAPTPAVASESTVSAEGKKLTASEAPSEPQQAAPTTAVESKPEASQEVKPAAVAEAKVAEPTAPEATKPEETTKVEPEKTTVPPPSPISQLLAALPSIKEEADYQEIWGVELIDENHVPTTIVLEKFLRANDKDITKAKAQLIEALKWRKKVQPRQLLDDVEFSKGKFGGLGYVTVYPKTEAHEKEIITWNIYGGVKDKKATFGDVEEFVRWRAALMELSLKELDLASATVPIPADGVDPYRMVQIHDYLNVSFLRMDPTIRAASKQVIQVFSMAYPELLREKFFVNVPLVMGWVFTAMKLFLSPETVKKFHPLSYGSSLAGELKSFGSELPVAYGGKGKDVTEGLTVKYAAVEEKKVDDKKAEEAKVKEPKPAEPKTEEKKIEEAETKKE